MGGVDFFNFDNRLSGDDPRVSGDGASRNESASGPAGSEWETALVDSVPSNLAAVDATLTREVGAPSADWALLLGRDPDEPPDQEILDLNRPAAAAKYLVDNWEALELPDGLNHDDLIDPSPSLPAEAREVMRYIGQNPSVFSALDSGGGRAGMNDGDIWRFDAADFVDKAREDLASATAAYGRYSRNNPVAGVEERQTARDVAILAANRGLLTASGPTQFRAENQRPMSGEFDARSLESLRSNAGLSDTLTAAAARVEARGASRLLGRSGDESSPIDGRRLFQWLETT